MKIIFFITFLSIFKFCYTSNSVLHIFQFVLLVNFCSFWKYAFHCRRIAKNEALKQHIFTSRFGIVMSLTWNARKCSGVNCFSDFSSFLDDEIMLPMEHGKQFLVKTSVFTAEVLLRDFRWRHLHCENNNFIMILIPTLHGKHNFDYVQCCLSLLFLLWLHTAPNVHSRSCSVIGIKSCIFHMLVPR